MTGGAQLLEQPEPVPIGQVHVEQHQVDVAVGGQEARGVAGRAGVTGAGMATLAGGLSSHRPELLDGVGLIVGIDRFMSEARALTNFAGNSIATVLIAHWTGGLDRPQLDRVLDGHDPFAELLMVDDHEPEPERVPAAV